MTYGDLEAAIGAALQAADAPAAAQFAAEYRRLAAEAPPELASAQALIVRAAFLSAAAEQACGRYAQAWHVLQPALAIVDRLPEGMARRVWLLAAASHVDHGDPAAARHALDEAAGRASMSNEILRLRIQLRLDPPHDLDRDIEACLRSATATNDRGNAADLLAERGRVYFEAGDFDRAEADWNRAAGSSTDVGRAVITLLQSRHAHLIGDYQRALDLLDTTDALLSPESAVAQEARLRRVLLRVDLNQERQALQDYRGLQDAWAGLALADAVVSLISFVEGVLGLATDANPAVRFYRSLIDDRPQRDSPPPLGAGPQRRAHDALARGHHALATGQRAEASLWLAEAAQLAAEQDSEETLLRVLHLQGHLAAGLEHDDAKGRGFLERAVALSERRAALLHNAANRTTYRAVRQSALRELIRAAAARNDAAAVFHYQELDRGRFLFDLARTAGLDSTPLPDAVAALDRQIDRASDAEAIPLQVRRDRLLEEHLWSRARHGGGLTPRIASLAELQQALAPGTCYLAATLVDRFVVLLAVRREGVALFSDSTGGTLLAQQVNDCRSVLENQIERYTAGATPDEQALEAAFDAVGAGPLGQLVHHALAAATPQRILWVPDGVLHGFPLPALRLHGRYLVALVETARGFGGSLHVHQQSQPRPWWFRRRRPVIVAEHPKVLPLAAAEAEAVKRRVGAARVFGHGPDLADNFQKSLSRARLVHCATHSDFDARNPLASSVRLPDGTAWRAGHWRGRPPEFVFLSTCRSTQATAYLGGEVYGLAASLMEHGVRGVVAGLWPVADREALALVDTFYTQLHSQAPMAALAATQRAAIDRGDSVLFWAVFTLFGDSPSHPLRR